MVNSIFLAIIENFHRDKDKFLKMEILCFVLEKDIVSALLFSFQKNKKSVLSIPETPKKSFFNRICILLSMGNKDWLLVTYYLVANISSMFRTSMRIIYKVCWHLDHHLRIQNLKKQWIIGLVMSLSHFIFKLNTLSCSQG